MREIDAERKDILSAALERRAEAVDGLEVRVDRDDLRTRVGGEHGVDAGIAAYVENTGGLGRGERCGDEGLLAGVIFLGVVGCGLGVVGPGRGTMSRSDLSHMREQGAEGLEDDLPGQFGVLDGADREVAGVTIGSPGKQCGEGDRGECGLAQSCRPGEGREDLLGLVAVPAGQRNLQGPAELRVGEHGEQKGADELSVGIPDGLVGCGALDGEHVDEDRLRPLKQDVERRCVLQDPTFLD